jgi:CarD family transcriptional regulator
MKASEAAGREPGAAQAMAEAPAAAKPKTSKTAKPKAAAVKAAVPESVPSNAAPAALATAAKPKLEKTVPDTQLPDAVLTADTSVTPADAIEPTDAVGGPDVIEVAVDATEVAVDASFAEASDVPELAAIVDGIDPDDLPDETEMTDADADAELDEPETAPAPVAAAEPERRPSVPEGERRPNINDRNPPRIPSKAENFVAGDHVVYPTHGVGKVERIVVEEIAGHSLELIHITFEENRMTLRVPVSKARSAGLRKLASRKMFDEALAVLKGRARIKRTMWSRRAQEYEAKINSGDPLSIAEVVRDLHRNAGQPDQSFSERQIYEAAMDRLAAELGALDKTDKSTAAIKLLNFLKTIA